MTDRIDLRDDECKLASNDECEVNFLGNYENDVDGFHHYLEVQGQAVQLNRLEVLALIAAMTSAIAIREIREIKEGVDG